MLDLWSVALKARIAEDAVHLLGSKSWSVFIGVGLLAAWQTAYLDLECTAWHVTYCSANGAALDTVVPAACCAPPPALGNGSFSNCPAGSPVGMQCEGSCDPNFEPVDGVLPTVDCEATGLWGDISGGCTGARQWCVPMLS